MSDGEVRAKLIQAGVRNLKEFGYPSVTADNLVTDLVYRKFFVSMLNDDENRNVSRQVERVRLALVAECEANEEASR